SRGQTHPLTHSTHKCTHTHHTPHTHTHTHTHTHIHMQKGQGSITANNPISHSMLLTYIRQSGGESHTSSFLFFPSLHPSFPLSIPLSHSPSPSLYFLLLAVKVLVSSNWSLPAALPCP